MKIYHLIVRFFIYPSSKYPITPAVLPSPLPQLNYQKLENSISVCMPRPLTGQGLFKAGNPEKWPGPWEFLQV